MNREKLEQLAGALELGKYLPTRGRLVRREADGQYCYCAQGVALLLGGWKPEYRRGTAFGLSLAPGHGSALSYEADPTVAKLYGITEEQAGDLLAANDYALSDEQAHAAAAKVVRRWLQEDA